ncbi:N-acetyltransferase [Dictyobacter alpinus]|uniref:N-acetyltransferase n=1 Tax=Dictyobacter alpinus TaxID=2014873 RepID=A0A402B0U9_9CHLR|nr:GNAT family N-acetyltransferase [Dictyobacter alpinus]GCE24980.1 N-acetyltransferase [Dictyobacter alpinus]
MQITRWSLATPNDYTQLFLLLHDADEDDERIRRLVTDGLHTSYIAWRHEQMVGAVVMRWQGDASEIEYIAVAADVRGKGCGKAMLAHIIEEARVRRVSSILVGTDNTAFGNIAFYQKCGFRMDHIRSDFFSYIQPTLIVNGIPMRDMLVLRYTLDRFAN